MEELKKTAYDIVRKLFSAYCHKFSKIVIKTAYRLYENNVTLFNLFL